MTKDELMQIALGCGFKRAPVAWHHLSADQDDVISFANAILERAASECDELSKGMQQDDHMQGCIDSAYQVRALKIKEGE